MARVIPDSLDFSAYEEQTNASVAVRPARAFEEGLVRAFKPREPKDRFGGMWSTKLGKLLDHAEGEVTVYAGYNGHRKTFLTSQIVLDLCNDHKRVLECSFEMSPEKSLKRKARQMSGSRTPTERWLRAFSAWTDTRLWLFDHQGNIALHQFIAVCRYFADELQGQHVILDSFMCVVESEEHLDAQKNAMQALVRVARDTGMHLHIVAHCKKPQTNAKYAPVPTKYDIRGSMAISDLAHNVVMVWANMERKDALSTGASNVEPDQLVVVAKQREGSFEGALKLWWDGEWGGDSGRFINDFTDTIYPYEVCAPW